MRPEGREKSHREQRALRSILILTLPALAFVLASGPGCKRKMPTDDYEAFRTEALWALKQVVLRDAPRRSRELDDGYRRGIAVLESGTDNGRSQLPMPLFVSLRLETPGVYMLEVHCLWYGPPGRLLVTDGRGAILAQSVFPTPPMVESFPNLLLKFGGLYVVATNVYSERVLNSFGRERMRLRQEDLEGALSIRLEVDGRSSASVPVVRLPDTENNARKPYELAIETIRNWHKDTALLRSSVLIKRRAVIVEKSIAELETNRPLQFGTPYPLFCWVIIERKGWETVVEMAVHWLEIGHRVRGIMLDDGSGEELHYKFSRVSFFFDFALRGFRYYHLRFGGEDSPGVDRFDQAPGILRAIESGSARVSLVFDEGERSDKMPVHIIGAAKRSSGG